MRYIYRSDLQNRYSWNRFNKHDPKVYGHCDTTEFNKYEGYEVLYLLNGLYKVFGVRSDNNQNAEIKQFCKHVEFLLRRRMPQHITTQKKAVVWLTRQLLKQNTNV